MDHAGESEQCSSWAYAICVVTFDLELGQVIEVSQFCGAEPIVPV